MASQPTKNYTNWTSRRKVMITLVFEIWCKGTPFDVTIYRESLHNNIHCNNNVEGLVVSFTSRGLICMSFFLIFEGSIR